MAYRDLNALGKLDSLCQSTKNKFTSILPQYCNKTFKFFVCYAVSIN